MTSYSRRTCLQAILGGAAVKGIAALNGPSGLLPRLRADELELSNLYVDDDVDQAIKNGVKYLVSAARGNGAIVDRGHDVAMTALAIMAMASVGIEPGAYNEASLRMSQAIDFVLDARNQDAQGYFGKVDGSRMYGHGIITLMLTEMLGMGATQEQNKRIHHSLEKAIKLILAAQDVRKSLKLAGGWRYTPTASDSDLSVSVWQLMALRSAKNDGLDVPASAIDNAIEYLQNSYTAPSNARGEQQVGGFSYTPGHHHPSFTMTSAGLLAMQVCGQYESPMVKGAAEWLLQHPPRTRERFFHYGLYYYAQGMHQAGGQYAKRADTVVPSLLLDIQEPRGSWLARGSEEKNIGRVYSTSLSILSLSVRYHYLPIYQR